MVNSIVCRERGLKTTHIAKSTTHLSKTTVRLVLVLFRYIIGHFHGS